MCAVIYYLIKMSGVRYFAIFAFSLSLMTFHLKCADRRDICLKQLPREFCIQMRIYFKNSNVPTRRGVRLDWECTHTLGGWFDESTSIFAAADVSAHTSGVFESQTPLTPSQHPQPAPDYLNSSFSVSNLHPGHVKPKLIDVHSNIGKSQGVKHFPMRFAPFCTRQCFQIFPK